MKTRNRIRVVLTLAAMAMVTLVTSTTSAQSITIVNHSFETPDLLTDRSQAIGGATWRRIGDGSDPLGLDAIGLAKRVGAGTFATILDPTPDPADAEQAVYLNGAAESIFQVLTDTLQANTTYTLTVDAGDRDGLAFQDCEIRLGTVDDPGVSADNGSNLLAATVVNNTTPVNGAGPNDGWETWVSTFTTRSGVVGDQLRVELVTTGGIQSYFDNVRLEATTVGGSPHPGDANDDGWVDVTDLGILATNWQQSPRTFSEGNFNEPLDDVVNVTDLGILATNWQTGPNPPSASVTAVPEPTSLALFGLGGLAMIMCRRR